MRPQAIRNFDYLYLGSLVLGVISFVLNYDAIIAEVQRETAANGMEMGGGLAIGSLIFGLIVSLALWFLVSRLRIEIVKWVLVLFFVFGLIGMPAVFAQLPSLHAVISLIVTVMQAIAIYFLFTPEAKAFFADKGGNHID
ncbi:hypothetical protein [Qipengyuania oceanensis]|uniref:Uncharacterized protein n=1 Tax=Qipengyuania oceanensis TaxID=1463597 RepID=A0A844YEL8_9SPHN|nr:hypothetical protein [Qipengyuania oceanensis]MXO62980.1 hypothetical protein [Qipengyuania oceanensis]